jgi:PHD/YefM family antitoxin component YafN of YafNO toxin-antitoxin module
MRVTCSEFRANFGRYLDLTLTEPVIITNFARDQGVLISAEVFHTLRARISAKAQKPLGESITIPISDFQKRYAHYQEVALNNPIVITTHFREKSVLLSPEAFDTLFQGSLPKKLDVSNMLKKVTTSEFQQKVGHHLSAALATPIIITKHGREKNALLSIGTLRALLRTKAAKAEVKLAEAITVTATELELQAGSYQDISITRLVIVTVKEREQNVLMSTNAFKRLIRDGKIALIHHVGNQTPSPAELRDKYTYQNALNLE